MQIPWLAPENLQEYYRRGHLLWLYMINVTLLLILIDHGKGFAVMVTTIAYSFLYMLIKNFLSIKIFLADLHSHSVQCGLSVLFTVFVFGVLSEATEKYSTSFFVVIFITFYSYLTFTSWLFHRFLVRIGLIKRWWSHEREKECYGVLALYRGICALVNGRWSRHPLDHVKTRGRDRQ